MKKSILTYYILAITLLFVLTISAQTSQQPLPPKGDGSHSKDTSFTTSDTYREPLDTVPPKKVKRKSSFSFGAPSPGNSNATNGSNIAPGR